MRPGQSGLIVRCHVFVELLLLCLLRILQWLLLGLTLVSLLDHECLKGLPKNDVVCCLVLEGFLLWEVVKDLVEA